jgi:translation initiation factor 3 subunit D
VQSLLSGADAMKLAFVTRAARTDADNHAIVGTVTYVPAQFAAQQGLTASNMWGVLKWLVTLVRKHAVNLQEAEGASDEDFVAKFVLLREPNAAKLTFYAVPPGSFEDDADGEGGDDEDDGGDDGAGWHQAGGAGGRAAAAPAGAGGDKE